MWIIAAVFTACAAIRLARFNVETETDDDHLTFIGLPTPAAAGCIAGFGILFYTLRREGNPLQSSQDIDWYMRRFLPAFTLALSASDGIAHSVPACGESIAQRASQLGTCGGTAVLAGCNYRIQRLQRADYLLPFCAGSAGTIRMAALAESATGNGAIF